MLYNYSVSGVWTLKIPKMPKCRDLRQLLASENQTGPVVWNTDTFWCYKTLKNDFCPDFRHFVVWIPDTKCNVKTCGAKVLKMTIKYGFQTLNTVNVRNPNTFGFRSGGHSSVQIYFERPNNAEIQTKHSDFRHKFVSENRTKSRLNVQFSDSSLS